MVEDVGGPSGRVLVVTTATRPPSALRPSTPHPSTAPALTSPASAPAFREQCLGNTKGLLVPSTPARDHQLSTLTEPLASSRRSRPRPKPPSQKTKWGNERERKADQETPTKYIYLILFFGLVGVFLHASLRCTCSRSQMLSEGCTRLCLPGRLFASCVQREKKPLLRFFGGFMSVLR